jgi:hypothetical protein
MQRKEDDAPVIYQETANAHTAATQLILLFVISYYYCLVVGCNSKKKQSFIC